MAGFISKQFIVIHVGGNEGKHMKVYRDLEDFNDNHIVSFFTVFLYDA